MTGRLCLVWAPESGSGNERRGREDSAEDAKESKKPSIGFSVSFCDSCETFVSSAFRLSALAVRVGRYRTGGNARIALTAPSPIAAPKRLASFSATFSRRV